MSTRLKGDETYPQCGYCHKPIREDQDSTSIGVGGDTPAPFHGKCFSKWCKEVPKRLAGGNKMAGGQMVMDPTTGELVDEDVIRQLTTDTTITGRVLLTERCKLGEFVKVEMVCKCVHEGRKEDDKGAKFHVQTLKVTSIDDVKRGAI